MTRRIRIGSLFTNSSNGRCPPAELRARVAALDDSGLSPSQLASLVEFLPTDEEAAALRAHPEAERAALGECERCDRRRAVVVVVVVVSSSSSSSSSVGRYV